MFASSVLQHTATKSQHPRGSRTKVWHQFELYLIPKQSELQTSPLQVFETKNSFPRLTTVSAKIQHQAPMSLIQFCQWCMRQPSEACHLRVYFLSFGLKSYESFNATCQYSWVCAVSCISRYLFILLTNSELEGAYLSTQKPEAGDSGFKGSLHYRASYRLAQATVWRLFK